MIGIVGLGLMGGSLAKSIKNNFDVDIVAFDTNEEQLIAAKNDGFINTYATEIDSNFKNCDIIFLCTPVEFTVEMVKKLSYIIKPECILTDIGSTKENITKSIYKIKNINFIGGHPMTGSEKSGCSNSSEILFENAFYIITPPENAKYEHISYLKNIIEQIGAIYIEMTPKEHDQCVSVISHIPHILASCLVNYMKNSDNKDEIYKTLCAGGFKDITRIASSNGELWYSIIISNKENILLNFKAFLDEQVKFYNFIKNEDSKIIDYIDRGKRHRNSIEDKASSLKLNRIDVDVPDEPNVIGVIATLFGKNNINIKNIGINNNRDDSSYALTILFENEGILKNASKVLEQYGYIYKII